MASEPLADFPVHHAGRRPILHPHLGCPIQAQTAVCYLRFLRTVRVDHLELPPANDPADTGRWVPGVPTHPAHLRISALDGNRWRLLREADLPYNPSLAGEGLAQDMPIEAMEAFFARAIAAAVPHRVDLGGVESDCLRVECDREHPVWPNHGECNGGPFHVPFGTLRRLRAFGDGPPPPAAPAYQPQLERRRIAPAAPAGMTLRTRNPLEVVYAGARLSIGFSLVRPLCTRLTWDHFAAGLAPAQRLLFRGVPDELGGLSGPSYITPWGNHVAQVMTGAVEVAGNQVRYLDLDTGCGVRVDATFTVTADGIVLALEQRAERDLAVLEAAAWRFLWNMRSGLTSVAGVPAAREGRNGFVELPALLTADAGGFLGVRRVGGDGVLHTESYRRHEARAAGFVLTRPETPDAPACVPAGTTRGVFALRPGALLPVAADREASLTEGVRHCWSAGFSAFRPEFGGFSNNAISTNCHVNQHTAADFAAFTATPEDGPRPLALVQYSIGRALLDGGGYGYHRSLYLDSDPILLSGAGRVYQLGAEAGWLEAVGPGIAAAARRVLDGFDDATGMIVCRSLSGNSSTYRWSSNAMDVIGFGHIDAYVNAWAFRGLQNAAVLCRELGDATLAARCTEVAAALADNYARQLVNPETGWVAGWRSRDGALHDFGFVWINGVAGAFGVMDEATTRRALGNLEARRRAVFPESGYSGLPLNLLPIAPTDHMLSRMDYQLRPTYENYTDGALSPVFAAYYIRALASSGFHAEAAALVDALEQGFADGLFHGPYGTGKEFMTWTGADSGYEGTFGPNSGALYAIAVQRGAIVPPAPEWWPAPARADVLAAAPRPDLITHP